MLKLGKVGEFNPDNPPEGVWGTFAEGVTIKVRKLTGEVLREIRKKHSTKKMEPDQKSRGMVAVEKLDDDMFEAAINDYLIEDFKGIGDEEGIALSVDVDSKTRILNYLPLKDWVWAFAQTIDTTEAEVKNL